MRRDKQTLHEAAIPRYYFSDEWIILRQTTLDRDGHVCQYCGGYAFQADHILPRKQGGPDALTNLVSCCLRCNRIAGGAVFDSFEHKRRFIRYHVRRKRGKRSRD